MIPGIMTDKTYMAIRSFFTMELSVVFATWRAHAQWAKKRRYKLGWAVQHAFDVWYCTAHPNALRRAHLARRLQERRRLCLWLIGAWWRWWATRRIWLRSTVPYFGPPLRPHRRRR